MLNSTSILPNFYHVTGLYPAIWGKGPWLKLGKIIDLMLKLGKINDIKHNNGSKVYPQNQVILDCFMPSTMFKYHSDMGHCFS